MIGIPVSEIMRKGVITVKKTDTVEHAAKVMKKSKIGRVVVTDNGKIAGILADKDIIEKIVANAQPISTHVSKIMSYPVKTLTPETDLEEAITSMNKFNISGMPVTSRGRLVGIVTERDLVAAEPGLLTLMREKENLEHITPEEKELMISGVCEECENYTDGLRLVDGRFLCEDCR
jgi:CBS domain-containing protein